jgi:hypothetical protein
MRVGRAGSASFGWGGPLALCGCGAIHGLGAEAELPAGVKVEVEVVVEVAVEVVVEVPGEVVAEVVVEVALEVAVEVGPAIAALAVTEGAGAPPQPTDMPQPTRMRPTRRRVFPIFTIR